MALQRPVWTICFFVIWILVIPGVLLTHISVGKLIPVLSDLPDNVIKGFDEVFKFAYLEQDSLNLQTTCSTALTQCNNINAATVCPASQYVNYLQVTANLNVLNTQSIQTVQPKAAINALFANSLAIVDKVANDKYFGTDDLQNTATQLNSITAEIARIEEPTMSCITAVPVFCEIYNNAGQIVSGMAQVTKAIDEFRNADIVQRWDDHKSFLTALHGMPYIMVMALLLFSFFWLRGGVCCCCRGGTKSSCFALIPFALFWLVAFVIYLVVFIVGTVIKYHKNEIHVGDALKGNPTLEEAIDHIKTEYPEFWKTVFADMVDPLDLLLSSSYFFVIVAVLIIFYAFLECCCMPYRKSEEEAAASS